MTNEEAKRILHPDTTLEALAEIEYFAGFNGREAKIKAVEEACVIACEALEKQMPMKPDYVSDRSFDCPNCNATLWTDGDDITDCEFCCACGQAIDWSE